MYDIYDIFVGLLAVIGTQKLFVWYKRYQKSVEREVFKLVSEIINVVEQHHQNAGLSPSGSTQDIFLAINHVRDNLILPKDRKRMAGLWEKAVRFLDENESRWISWLIFLHCKTNQSANKYIHIICIYVCNYKYCYNLQNSKRSATSCWRGISRVALVT